MPLSPLTCNPPISPPPHLPHPPTSPTLPQTPPAPQGTSLSAKSQQELIHDTLLLLSLLLSPTCLSSGLGSPGNYVVVCSCTKGW